MSVLWCEADARAVLDLVGHSRALQLAGGEAVRRREVFRFPADGDAHIAARVLARLLLSRPDSRIAPSAWEIDQLCDNPQCRRFETHGRPVISHGGVEGPALSWTHSSGVAACAVAPHAERIGIDVEQVDHRALPPLDLTWADWVRAEALVKVGFCSLDEALTLPLEPGVVVDAAGRAIILRDLDIPTNDEGPAIRLVGALAVRPPTSVNAVIHVPLSALNPLDSSPGMHRL